MMIAMHQAFWTCDVHETYCFFTTLKLTNINDD